MACEPQHFAAAPLLPRAGHPQSPNSALSAADRWIQAKADADSFSDAVIVAKKGVPLLRRGYGLANRETKERVVPETRCDLVSIGKLITRIAIWQLVAAGKLQLDVSIGQYLPDYPNDAVPERVIARHLIEMRSGIGTFCVRSTSIGTPTSEAIDYHPPSPRPDEAEADARHEHRLEVLRGTPAPVVQCLCRGSPTRARYDEEAGSWKQGWTEGRELSLATLWIAVRATVSFRRCFQSPASSLFCSSRRTISVTLPAV